MPTRQEVMDYIIQSAQARGIDPRISLKVFQGESGFNPAAKLITPRESSHGVTQLNIKNGLGVDALRRGIDPRDVNQWKETIDFSHDQVKRGGWTPWSAAAKAGVGRWTGVNGRDGSNIDIGTTPQLNQLKPDKPTAKPVNFEDTAQANILKQMGPTEAPTMARHSGFEDAIRASMKEKGLQYAGFVPPGLTRGAAETRGAASKNVEPKGMIKDTPAAKRAEELKNVPDAGEQIGKGGKNTTAEEKAALADWAERQDKWLNGDGPHPGDPPQVKGLTVPPDVGTSPRVRGAADPAGAADPRTGTALERVDPNLAAQNDPAQAVMSAKLRGQARGGPGPSSSTTIKTGPGGGPDNLTKAGVAAGAAGVGAAAGVATKDEDPALKAVQEKIASSGANVDPGTAEMMKKYGVDASSGVKSSLLGPMIGQGLPAFKEAMKDPATQQAAMQVAKSVISSKARIDAQQADKVKDPTYYQRIAAQGDPSAPGAEQAMMRAVARDNQGGGMRGPQVMARGEVPQAARPPQTVPSQVAQTPQPPSVEQQILQQAGEGTTQSPGPGGNTYTNEASRYTNTPGAVEPNGGQAGIPGGVAALPQPAPPYNDPAMMQLMQFFTGGGAP